MSDYWDANAASQSGESAPLMSPGPALQAAIYPPQKMLWVIASVVFVVGLLFLVDSDAAHWIGYVLGAFGTAVCVVLYRHRDLIRRRSPAYIDRPTYDKIATGLLLAGIVFGVVHVYMALQETTLA